MNREILSTGIAYDYSLVRDNDLFWISINNYKHVQEMDSIF